MATYALFVVGAYLLGAIPFGLLIGRAYGVDIRRHGSGNIGATNALRTIGWRASAIVLVLDILKATLPLIAARWLVGDAVLDAMLGLAAVAGHNWPVYIGWKGGRGVASSLGVMAVLCPVATLGAAAIGVSLIAWSRYVSLGSVTGAVAVPVFTVVYARLVAPIPLAYIVLSVALGILVVVQHRDNIKRLLAGNERKLGQKAEKLEAGQD